MAQTIIGIPAYSGVDLFDVTGPMEVFSWVNKALAEQQRSDILTTVLLSEDGSPITSHCGLVLSAQGKFADFQSLDVIWVPGGSLDALGRFLSNPANSYFAYLKQVAVSATWVCSVCEGALLLAASGLLDGHLATTHWNFVDCLKRFPNVVIAEGHPRFVRSGNRLTGGGVSSGLDESLKLVELIYGTNVAEAVQTTIQYFPSPPVNGAIPPAQPCRVKIAG